MLEIEADGGHEAAGQRLLLLAREGSLQWQRCRLAPLARQHVVEEAGQEGGEILEDGVDPGRGAVGLVLIEQRVVERASKTLGLGGAGQIGRASCRERVCQYV